MTQIPRPNTSLKISVPGERMPYLSIREIASELGVSYNLIRGEILKGNLAAVRVGARYCVSSEELDAYQSRNRVRVDAERRKPSERVQKKTVLGAKNFDGSALLSAWKKQGVHIDS
ncbi:MAG: excisionase family DNA-binding protein [Patescibacteria group bacterium]|nr:excisionase family DNA-binding protein [Patescibacteria group bacterium]